MNKSASLKRLKSEQSGYSELYLQGLNLIQQSGVLEVLREEAEPQIVSAGANLSSQAIESARSAGYFQCLKDLIYFRERFLIDRPDLNSASPDYGGLSRAYQDGDLTEAELHAIRTNTKPKYSAISARIEHPDAGDGDPAKPRTS